MFRLYALYACSLVLEANALQLQTVEQIAPANVSVLSVLRSLICSPRRRLQAKGGAGVPAPQAQDEEQLAASEQQLLVERNKTTAFAAPAPAEVSAEVKAQERQPWAERNKARAKIATASMRERRQRKRGKNPVSVAPGKQAAVAAAPKEVGAAPATTTEVEAAAPEVGAAPATTTEVEEGAVSKAVPAAPKVVANVFVVGMSGHGKSTFLNAVLEESGEEDFQFAVNPNKEACTKTFDEKVVSTEGQRVRLIDAPGWLNCNSDDSDKEWYDWKKMNGTKGVQNLVPINPLSKVNANETEKNVLVLVVKADRGADSEIESNYQDGMNFVKQVLEQNKNSSSSNDAEMSGSQWTDVILVLNSLSNWQGNQFKTAAGRAERKKQEAGFEDHVKAFCRKTGLEGTIDHAFIATDIQALQEKAAGEVLKRVLASPKERAIGTRSFTTTTLSMMDR